MFPAGSLSGADGSAPDFKLWSSVTADDDFGLNDPFLSVDARDMRDGVTGGDVFSSNSADADSSAAGCAATNGDAADDEADAATAANSNEVSAADRARALAKAKMIKWDELADGYGFCEFIQYPGETIFVPSGWWHAVINVDDTIAYTQNFTNMSNFPLVWRNMRSHNKRTTRRWLRNMDRQARPFAALARAINEHDGYALSEFKVAKQQWGNRPGVTDSESGSEISASDSSSYVSSFEETEDEDDYEGSANTNDASATTKKKEASA